MLPSIQLTVFVVAFASVLLESTASGAQPPQVRNCRWGDSPAAVLEQQPDDQLEVRDVDKRCKSAVGVVKLDGELFKIDYSFFDDQLVSVYLSAFYARRPSNPFEGVNRDRSWNPFSTANKLEVLMREKYGPETESD